MPEPTAVVYIIDDDESTREALRGLLRSVDLAARAYASVDDFLAAPAPGHARLPGAGRAAARGSVASTSRRGLPASASTFRSS